MPVLYGEERRLLYEAALEAFPADGFFAGGALSELETDFAFFQLQVRGFLEMNFRPVEDNLGSLQPETPAPRRVRRFVIAILWLAAGGLALTFATSLVLHYTKLALFLGGECRDQIVNEIPSPDGKRKAVLHVRDCGATTRASTYMSVVRRSASGAGPASAEVLAGYEFPWNGKTHKVGAEWSDNTYLDVWYGDDVELTHLNDQVGSVHVHFQLRKTPDPKQ